MTGRRDVASGGAARAQPLSTVTAACQSRRDIDHRRRCPGPSLTLAEPAACVSSGGTPRDFMQQLLGEEELGQDFEAYLLEEEEVGGAKRVGLWINSGHTWGAAVHNAANKLSQNHFVYVLYGVDSGVGTRRALLQARAGESSVAARVQFTACRTGGGGGGAGLTGGAGVGVVAPDGAQRRRRAVCVHPAASPARATPGAAHGSSRTLAQSAVSTRPPSACPARSALLTRPAARPAGSRRRWRQ